QTAARSMLAKRYREAARENDGLGGLWAEPQSAPLRLVPLALFAIVPTRRRDSPDNRRRLRRIHTFAGEQGPRRIRQPRYLAPTFASLAKPRWEEASAAAGSATSELFLRSRSSASQAAHLRLSCIGMAPMESSRSGMRITWSATRSASCS